MAINESDVFPSSIEKPMPKVMSPMAKSIRLLLNSMAFPPFMLELCTSNPKGLILL